MGRRRPRGAVDLVRAYLARLEAAGRWLAPGELLFSCRGKLVAYRTTLSGLARLTLAAGLGRLGKKHRLRHTFGTPPELRIGAGPARIPPILY